MDECHYLDTSKMINFDVDKISCEVDAVSTFDDSPITYETLSPTNKEWKITDALQSKLRVYLKSPCSHGHFYPPPSYWNIQKAFMEESGFIIRQSSVPYAHGKKSKAGSSFADARGNGIFCGRQGICQGTQLVFMGLIYHGKFDLHAMKNLWTDRNKNDINILHRSPQADFEGHILEVEDDLFILGHPGCATSMFNQNPNDVLNHCEIKDNSSAIIEFNVPGFAFTEMYLLYDGKIKMNKRPIVSIVPVSLFVAGEPTKSLFQRNEKTPFHILQAETTKLPGDKKKKLPPAPPPPPPVPSSVQTEKQSSDPSPKISTNSGSISNSTNYGRIPFTSGNQNSSSSSSSPSSSSSSSSSPSSSSSSPLSKIDILANLTIKEIYELCNKHNLRTVPKRPQLIGSLLKPRKKH
jgi:hypothetical protein